MIRLRVGERSQVGFGGCDNFPADQKAKRLETGGVEQHISVGKKGKGRGLKAEVRGGRSYSGFGEEGKGRRGGGNRPEGKGSLWY